MQLTPKLKRRLTWMGLVFVLALTALAYWPGTQGTFLIDDYPNLLQNPAIQHLQPTLGSFLNATFSSDSGPGHRPIAMATFALNVLADGGAAHLDHDATAMKWTNVGIHLLNGLLVFILIRLILREYRRLRPETPEDVCNWVALIIAAAWMLAPINLTAVLYVIQRMTSLAATFTLLALIAYVAGRRKLYENREPVRGWILVLASAIVFAPLSILSKEDGALTLLYAGIIEWTLFGLRDITGKRQPALWAYFGVFLVLPAILGLWWLVPISVHSTAWQTRDFNMLQRVLTEGRVIWHYLWWTLVPNIGSLTLFHDAFPVSRNLLHPWTTLIAWLGIAGLLAGSIATRRRFPLVSLGILWFLAGQVMTASFIPLELVFEHREYLPSLGLFIALFGTLGIAVNRHRYKRLAIGALVSIVAMYGVALGLRSFNWSNPLRQLATAARNHPDSPRATYSYARELTVISNIFPQVRPKAFKALEKAAKVPGQGLLPYATLIILAHQSGKPANSEWYHRMAGILEQRSPNAGDYAAVNSLIQCAIREKNPCHLDPLLMETVFAAGLTRTPPDFAIMSMYGNYLLNVTHEPRKARHLFQILVKQRPASAVYHFDLGVSQLASGNLPAAQAQLSELKRLNKLGMSNQHIQSLSNLIAQAQEAKSTHGKTQ